jgi:hypothetical protein
MTLPTLNLRDLFWLVVLVAMGLGWWVMAVASCLAQPRW